MPAPKKTIEQLIRELRREAETEGHVLYEILICNAGWGLCYADEKRARSNHPDRRTKLGLVTYSYRASLRRVLQDDAKMFRDMPRKRVEEERLRAKTRKAMDKFRAVTGKAGS